MYTGLAAKIHPTSGDAVALLDPRVYAHLALSSTAQTVWSAGPSFREERNLHAFEEFDVAHNAVSTVVLTESAGSFAQTKLV